MQQLLDTFFLEKIGVNGDDVVKLGVNWYWSSSQMTALDNFARAAFVVPPSLRSITSKNARNAL